MALVAWRTGGNIEIHVSKITHALEITSRDPASETLEHLAEHGSGFSRSVLVKCEDEVLIAVVRERVASPERVKVLLDDL